MYRAFLNVVIVFTVLTPLYSSAEEYLTVDLSGNLNILLTAPHGGKLTTLTPAVPDREDGCLINGECVFNHSCGTQDPTKYENCLLVFRNYLFLHSHIFLHNFGKKGSTDSSVGRASDSWSQGRRFDPHPWCGVVFLSKTLYHHCLVLIKIRKPSQTD